MSKVILEFDPIEDREELELALKAGKMHSALWEIQNNLFRQICKYESHPNEKINSLLKSLGNQGLDLVELLREEFNSTLQDHNIDL